MSTMNPHVVLNIEEDDDDAYCRLRHGLNTECLMEIFEYLPVNTLLTLSAMDDYYKEIIREHVIHKKDIVFNQSVFGYEKFFKTFGKRITSIIFHDYDFKFDDLLLQMTKHCSEGRLRKFHLSVIQSRFNLIVNDTIVNKALHCLRNVNSISIEKSTNVTKYFFKQFWKRLEKLQTLKFTNMRLRTLETRRVRNLTELHLVDVTVSPEDLLKFLRHTGSNLQKFVNIESIREENVREIGEALVRYSGDNMRSYCDVTDSHPLWYEIRLFKRRYEFLSGFKNLEEVTLSSICSSVNDLQCTMEICADLKKLKTLNAHVKFCHCMNHLFPDKEFNIKNGFDKLNAINIFTNPCNANIAPPISFTFFTRNAAKISKNVRTLGISSPMGLIYPSALIQSMPELRKLSIGNAVQFTSNDILNNLRHILMHRNDVEPNTNDSIEVVLLDDVPGVFINIEEKPIISKERIYSNDFLKSMNQLVQAFTTGKLKLDHRFTIFMHLSIALSQYLVFVYIVYSCLQNGFN